MANNGHTRKSLAMIGQKYQMLTVLGIGAPRLMLVQCDCGIVRELKPKEIRKYKSCGCQQFGSSNRSHGQSHTRTYNIWSKMVGRCSNVNDAWHKKHYIDRGITVCERWLKFENFLTDMGHAPEGLTIERKENDEGYSLNNCVWATRGEQAFNRRNNRRSSLGGEMLTQTEIAIKTGRHKSTIYRRMKLGFTPEQIASSEKLTGRFPKPKGPRTRHV